MDILGTIRVDFDMSHQLVINFLCSSDLERNFAVQWNTSADLTDFEKGAGERSQETEAGLSRIFTEEPR
jgi:hypothetical protein